MLPSWISREHLALIYLTRGSWKDMCRGSVFDEEAFVEQHHALSEFVHQCPVMSGDDDEVRLTPRVRAPARAA